jgi:surfactin synthase thioesterase subunit
VSIEEFTDMLDTATEVLRKGPGAPLVLFGHRLGG